VTGRDRLFEEDAHDLAEAQGDNGEVVARAISCGRASSTPNRQATSAPIAESPKRQVQTEMRRSKQGVGIRAHCVEGDVSQVEQPGEAHDDVQA